MTNLSQVQEGIKNGDIINDVDTVTGKSLTLIYTDGHTYATKGGSRDPDEFDYRRVMKVTRNNEVIYVSKHGGVRKNAFGNKKVNTIEPRMGWR